jgi:hypothetical protein
MFIIRVQGSGFRVQGSRLRAAAGEKTAGLIEKDILAL